MSARGFLLVAMLLAGCDGGAQTLGRERTPQTADLEPLPWFGGPDYYTDFPRGFPADPSFFPIGVWMQNPDNAERYASVGINHFVGLWEGPTEEQLATMTSVGMASVCEQAGVWREHLEDSGIQGWLQADGPDNAQELPDGSYGPCVDPAVTRARYDEMSAADPSRPVFLLLGQGVATPDWVGRGDCTGRTSDYPLYARAADVLVNYTYPLANEHPLELVATGIEKLNQYANFEKPVVADIEASSIDGLPRPTPHQLRAEVWMSLISGAAGVQYFCHRVTPEAFNETDCLDDPATAAAMTRINQELRELAPVLNSRSYRYTPVSSTSAPLRAVVKQVSSERYVLAVSMANAPTTASFPLAKLGEVEQVEVLGEGRQLVPGAEAFEDAFEPYAVHLYRLR